MVEPNGANERTKRAYYRFLKEARGRDPATIDSAASAIARFEAWTGGADFKRFKSDHAVAFKEHLAEAVSKRTGERLSKSTLMGTLGALQAFFVWLAREPGYRRYITYRATDFFAPSKRDMAIARARREKRVPTLEQVRHVLSIMPGDTPPQRRDRAVVALAMITGARAGAISSLRVGHVDVVGEFIEQDARSVRTKAGKTFRTYFMPVHHHATSIVTAWVRELKENHLFADHDPLFPATETQATGAGSFVAVGISRRGWNNSDPVRQIFRQAFEAAGLPYYNPHTMRDMLVRHFTSMNLTPEAIKAISQNLGHSDVMTTFYSYGEVPAHRQGELVRSSKAGASASTDDLLATILARLDGLSGPAGPDQALESSKETRS